MSDQDELARRLLAPLAGEPAGPSTVDIRRAMADGRRRLRTRRMAGAGVAAAVTMLAAAGVPVALDATRNLADHPPPLVITPSDPATPTPSPWPASSPVPAPDPPAQCDLELLPVPADALGSFAFGADPTGRIIHGKYVAPTDAPGGTRTQPVLWVDGERIEVDAPGREAGLRAVNSSGAAVGFSFVGTAEEEIHEVSWYYQDGVVTELPGERAVRTITEQGWAVGDRVVWRSPRSQPESLGVPGEIAGIEADGTVVGVRPGHIRRSFLWRPDGTVHDIPLPTIDGLRFGFRASVVNGQTVVGQAYLPDPGDQGRADEDHVMSYDLTTGEFTDLSGSASIQPWGWNRHGWFVGETDEFGGLWTPEAGLLRLPDLGAQNGYPPSSPRSVTDDGRTVVGDVTDPGGDQHAAVWRCA